MKKRMRGRFGNIPINRLDPGTPYSPGAQPDIRQFQEIRESLETASIGSPSLENYVLATYDTLLPRAIKFYLEFAFNGSVLPDNPAGPFGSFSFVVPEGRTLVLRSLKIRAGGNAPTSLSFAVDAFGMPAVIDPFTLSLRVNGGAAAEYGNLALYPPLVANREIPMFILASGGDTVTASAFFNDPAGDFIAAGSFSGDLLFSRGSDPVLEPVSIDPIPVRGGA